MKTIEIATERQLIAHFGQDRRQPSVEADLVEDIDYLISQLKVSRFKFSNRAVLDTTRRNDQKDWWRRFFR